MEADLGIHTHRVVAPVPGPWAGEFRLEVTTDGTDAIVRPLGELCYYSSPWLADAVESNLGDRQREVVMDLDGLTFVDTAGLRALLATAGVLTEEGRAVAFANPSPMLTRLTGILDIRLAAPSPTI